MMPFVVDGMLNFGALWHVLEGMVLSYTILYLLSNLILAVLGARPTLDQIRERPLLDFDQMDGSDSTIPTVAIVIAAYNEAMTIEETARSLMAIDYPALEIVIVNDGSTDNTRTCLRRTFRMRRRDVAWRQQLETASVHAIYEATGTTPENVKRFILVDKDNGGRADGLNAGIGVATADIVLTCDADCIVDPDALKHLVRILQTDPGILAVGGQVGVVNDCEVQDGRVVKPHVARSFLGLCQTLEYLRAFSLMRSGFSRINSLLLLSGAFMLMRREFAIDIGGFLTGRSHSRMLEEFTGKGTSTICEDMELIIRMHRYLREQGLRGRIVHAPVPLIWTEVPPHRDALAKQRRRWHRGLLEIFWMNRKMFLNPDYGRIGCFAMPYFVWFEVLGPWMEAAGLFLIPVLGLLGVLDPLRAGLIAALTLGSGAVLSLAAVIVSTWMEPSSLGGHRMSSMLGADTTRDRLALIAGTILGECGYRQMTVWWRLRATIEWFRGYDGWDKFERQGFRPAAGTALALALILCGAPAPASGQTPMRVTTTSGVERRAKETSSWWAESVAQWQGEGHKSVWGGASHVSRFGKSDDGIILGASPRRFGWGGMGLELRWTPDSQFSPHFLAAGETEFRMLPRTTGSVRVRNSHYTSLDLNSTEAGTVIYLPRDWWWSNHLVWQHSRFSGGATDDIIGFSTRLQIEESRWRGRLGIARAGESFMVESLGQTRGLMATILSSELSWKVGNGVEVLGGVGWRKPERGENNLYLHLGLRTGM